MQLYRSLHPVHAIFLWLAAGRPTGVFAKAFCIPLDLPVVYSWLHCFCHEPEKNAFSPVEQLLETYQALLTSDFSQSLLAEVNGCPLLQIDIIRADQDEISLKESIEPGDYCIHFLLSPRFPEPVGYFAHALNRCLYSFFSFPGVRRIYCKAPASDQRSNYLLQEAGFVLNKSVHDYTGRMNIYRHDYVPTLTGI